MNERVLAIRLLAGGLYDLLHMPETSTGAMLRKQTLRGEAPTRWQLCHPCNGDGIDRFRRRCVACDGNGRVKIDPYTDRVIAGEQAPAPPRQDRWLCNVCMGRGVEPKRPSERCRACQGDGQREHQPLTVVQPLDVSRGDPETVLEAAILRRDQAGSFHELEQCLAVLRRLSPNRHRVFWQVAVLRSRATADLDDRERRWLEEADNDLARMMPAVIRVPGYLHAQGKQMRRQLRTVRGNGADGRALALRNSEIRRLFESGEQTLPELVAATGLSRSRLYEIVYGEAS